MELTTGQNVALNNTGPELFLTWKTRPGFSSDIDASAFLLGADEKVLSDSSMIFFNQPHNDNRSVVMHSHAGEARFQIQLHALPAAVMRIAVTLVIDGSDTVEGLQRLTLHCGEYRYDIVPGDRREKALIVCHLYRHNGQWKLRAVGQGFDGGLHPLALHFGVDVAEPVPAAVPAVSLEKKLEKLPQLVSLAKPIRVSLEKHRLSEVKALVAFVVDA